MAHRLLLVALTVSSFALAFADDMPFWGESSPATNRAAAVSQTLSLTAFSSVEFIEKVVAVPEFSSEKFGAVLIIR